MRKIVTLFCVLVLLGVTAYADPLAVTPTTAADAMALAQLLAGPGITVISATYTGATNQGGTFTGGSGILPFDSGVLLTSGSINNALGPNNDTNAGSTTGTGGDAQLNALIPGYSTNDKNILEFTFEVADPSKTVVSFQYVFGSEEYNEYVQSQYNDVFGFFLNGANIALLPSTTTPVSINSVNCGSNPTFYRNNDPVNYTYGGCTAPPAALLNTQYDGLVGGLGSIYLYATGNLISGVNTIKLAIADAGDTILDSGVFLKADSFIPEPPPTVPEPTSMILMGTGLLAAAKAARKRIKA